MEQKIRVRLTIGGLQLQPRKGMWCPHCHDVTSAVSLTLGYPRPGMPFVVS